MKTVIGLIALALGASAQFNLFEDLFGQHGGRGQQQQQGQHDSGKILLFLNLFVNFSKVSCHGFVCPETNECVDSLNDCSCGWKIKCQDSTGSFLCISPYSDTGKYMGRSACERVDDFKKGLAF